MKNTAKARRSEKIVDDEAIAKRRVPCMVAYLHPFRLVEGKSSSAWAPSIQDINRASWDYVELHKLISGVDVGLPAPYHMVVARDGAVALPVLPNLRTDQQAVEFFNRNFACFLLGGVYCEAISLDGLDFGSIIDWKYLRVSTSAPAAPNRFHRLIRMKGASPVEAISLMGARSVGERELAEAMKRGRTVLDAIPELSGEFLLKGVTGIARRDWGAALSNLWIVVEQITSNLWSKNVLERARTSKIIAGRIDQLNDTRTWTASARHELLFQIELVSDELLASLAVARKARNALAHRGVHPKEEDAQASYRSAITLLETATGGLEIPLRSLDLQDHALSDPFKPREPTVLNPTHWMEIPKLPGEAELERAEAALRQPKIRRRTRGA